MARAAAGFNRLKGRIVGGERAGFVVEFVDEDFVEAQVAGECEVIGRIDEYGMGVGGFLAAQGSMLVPLC